MLAEGIFPCLVTGASYGANPENKNLPTVRIHARLDGGPNDGQLCTYEDVVNNKSAKYIAMSAHAVGWRTASLDSLKEDCAKWIAATGGKSTVEIKHIPFVDKKTGEPRVWDKCNSIGRGVEKPLAAVSGADRADADEAMAAFAAPGGAPADDAPHAANGRDDIPF